MTCPNVKERLWACFVGENGELKKISVLHILSISKFCNHGRIWVVVFTDILDFMHHIEKHRLLGLIYLWNGYKLGLAKKKYSHEI
jgi:hypothetical protein